MSLYYDSFSSAVIVPSELSEAGSTPPSMMSEVQHNKLEKHNAYYIDQLKKDSIQFASMHGTSFLSSM